jgi:hypothetical protein
MKSAHPATPPAETDRDAQDALLYRDVLHELIAMGMDHTRDVHRESQEQPSANGKARGAIAYANAHENLARGIRRSILLARTVAEPIPARRSPAERRVADRSAIIRAVEDKIHCLAADHDADTLTAEFHERLDSPDLAIDLSYRPVAEIIIQICRDLGLEAVPGADPWKRRKPRDLAILRARAAGPHPAPPITLAGRRIPPANSA